MCLRSFWNNLFVTCFNLLCISVRNGKVVAGGLFREYKVLYVYQLNILHSFVLAVKPNFKQRQQYFKTSYINLPVSILQFSEHLITVNHHLSKSE